MLNDFLPYLTKFERVRQLIFGYNDIIAQRGFNENMNIKNKNKVKNFNTDTLKLLLSLDDVQDKVASLREEIGLSPTGYKSANDFWEYYKTLLAAFSSHAKDAKTIELANRFKAIYKINGIIKKYGLTKDFFPPLRSYIGFNELELRVSGNLEMSMTYPEANEPLEVKMEIFRKPSTIELQEIQENIKDWSSRYLPAHRKIKTTAKADIDKDLRVLSMMRNKGIHREKIYDSQYLEIMKKKYDKGEITKKELLNAEHLNKGSIRIKKTKITSKTIGRKIFGTPQADQRVRTINKRIKNELNRRFKKV